MFEYEFSTMYYYILYILFIYYIFYILGVSPSVPILPPPPQQPLTVVNRQFAPNNVGNAIVINNSTNSDFSQMNIHIGQPQSGGRYKYIFYIFDTINVFVYFHI